MSEINRLADFILKYYGQEIGLGNPIEGESAVDVAIRLLTPQSSPSVTDLLANLARRVSSLEQQLSSTQSNVEKLAEELAEVKHMTHENDREIYDLLKRLDNGNSPKEVEAVTFEKFLDSIADKVAERLATKSTKIELKHGGVFIDGRLVYAGGYGR
jgi:DNA repair exonuclease SbcCD ATPase subunit